MSTKKIALLDGIADLTEQIRQAKTHDELLAAMNELHALGMQVRSFLTVAEREVLKRLREIREGG